MTRAFLSVFFARTVISPAVGSSNPAKILRNDVLPACLGPTYKENKKYVHAHKIRMNTKKTHTHIKHKHSRLRQNKQLNIS